MVKCNLLRISQPNHEPKSDLELIRLAIKKKNEFNLEIKKWLLLDQLPQ